MPPPRTTRSLLVAGLACLVLLPGLFLLLFKMRPAAASSLTRTISLWLPDPVARLILTASPLPVLERLGAASEPGAAGSAAAPAPGDLPDDAFAASPEGEAPGEELPGEEAAAGADSAGATASGVLASAAGKEAGKDADPGAEWPRMSVDGRATGGGASGSAGPAAAADGERVTGAGPRGHQADLPSVDVPLEPMQWTKDLGLTKEVQSALREARDGVGSGRTQELLRKAYADMDRQTDAAMSAALRRPLPPSPEALKRGTLWPLERARVTQEFGPSDFHLSPPRSWNGRRYAHFHSGLDLAAPMGTPVRAYDGGQVSRVGPLGNCGMSVLIVHPDKIASTYCHLDQGKRGPPVRPGQWVDAGDTVGYVGMTGLTTGPHTHFITKKGDIFDPRAVLPKAK